MKILLSLLLSFLPLISNAQIKLIPQEDNTFVSVDSLKTGDIIFTHSTGIQAEAVKAATDSVWTHTAVIFIEKGKPMVLEAVQPVQVISLQAYLKRGGSKHKHQVKRLKDPSKFTPAALHKAKIWATKHIGSNYDGRFLWSDKNLYCSELVWKVYQEATGIQLCPVKQVKDYNLKHPKVQSLIKARFGSIDRLKLDEKVVAPSDIIDSKLLVDLPTLKTNH